MKFNEYDAPILSDTETIVLQMLCRYHMLEKPFHAGKVARRCGVPRWIIEGALNSLIKRRLAERSGEYFIPAMQINGAPVPKPKIRYEGGVKIIECPTLYARGYARRNYL
ncbi:MAG: hypothetical protein H6867_04900 [Rhodospirillales bacterium]|nr:hypothetical protein [Rhodospirillales bacterium]MCB9994839.1 hypothetical protein [Rhodospirillales bacterium]